MTPTSVALVGQDQEPEGEPLGPRSLPVAATAHRLALALPSLDELKILEAYGRMFAASGLFPNVTRWEAAAAIIQYGSQLGIDAFTALKDIYWIKGKPSCDASLINSLIKRDHGGEALMPVESTAERCTIRFKRREWDRYEESTVTVEDYAHLANDKERLNWQTSRKDMLWARNVSQIGRRHFSDTIKGLYLREELAEALAVEAAWRPAAAETPQASAAPAPADDGAQGAPADRGRAGIVAETAQASVAPVPGPEDARAQASGNAVRAAAVKDLNEKVRDRFGGDDEIARLFGGIAAKQLRDDLVCWAYGLAAFKDATAEQVAEAALAVGGWTKQGAVKRYLLMETAHDARTLSTATDVATVAAEEGITDSFVVGAIDRALARFEAEAASQMADVDAAVESAVVP